MVKQLLSSFVLVLATGMSASAQAPYAIIPGPVPALSANCTIQRDGSNTGWACNAAVGVSQPLTDSLSLIADGADPTKVLAMQLSGITTATTRTWTIPDANLTIPSTIASLGANTFTALQTANGGIAATTVTASSTLAVTGTSTFGTHISVPAGSNIYLDGQGGGTRIVETGGVAMDFYANAVPLMRLNQSGGDGFTIYNTGGGANLNLNNTGALSLSYGTVTLGTSAVTNSFLNTPESMYFGIDVDNTQTDRIFAWQTNTASSGGTTLMTLNEAGALTLPNGASTAATFIMSGATTGGSYITISNSATAAYFGVNDNASGAFPGGGNNALVAYSSSSAGMALIAANASATIRFVTGSTLRGSFTSDGKLLVGSHTSPVLNTDVSVSYSAAVSNGLGLNDTNSTTGGEFIRFSIAGTQIGGVTRNAATSAVLYNTTSDARLKRDMGRATDLSGLRALVVHDFVWHGDQTGALDRNVFAQEAYAAIGRGVTPGDNNPLTVTEPWMVDKSMFVPDLIVGWQQHDALIAQLAARIAALEGRQ